MKVRANGLDLEVDDHGPRDGEPLLMIMGLGMQLVSWPLPLVQKLADHGFRVIRFDNRDAGLSQGFDDRGVPGLAGAMLRWFLHLPVKSPYRVADMAADARGVLDALGIDSAHVVGASLGGMVAQHLAADAPQRVRSLVLMMTTSGSRRLPGPTWAARRALVSAPAQRTPEGLVRHLEGVFDVIGSPAYRPEPQVLHDRVVANLARAYRPAGTTRQLVAVAADGDRTPLLARITAPTRVIHGEADPLVPVASGRDLVARIAGAVGDFIPGMGHDLPEALLSRFADGIAENARRA